MHTELWRAILCEYKYRHLRRFVSLSFVIVCLSLEMSEAKQRMTSCYRFSERHLTSFAFLFCFFFVFVLYCFLQHVCLNVCNVAVPRIALDASQALCSMTAVASIHVLLAFSKQRQNVQASFVLSFLCFAFAFLSLLLLHSSSIFCFSFLSANFHSFWLALAVFGFLCPACFCFCSFQLVLLAAAFVKMHRVANHVLSPLVITKQARFARLVVRLALG